MNDSPIGLWQTIDDGTGEHKAIVDISQDENVKLSGKIVRGLGRCDLPDRLCIACTDERKNQPILGMTIIRDMRKISDEIWRDGYILDPENGREYRCDMLLEDSGRKLIVRGFIGAPNGGRTQTWLRVQ